MADRIVEATPKYDAKGNLVGVLVFLQFDDGQGRTDTLAHAHPSRAPFELGKFFAKGETLASFLAAVGYDPITKKPRKADFVAFERTHFAAEKARWLATLPPLVPPVRVDLDSAP